MLNLSQHFILGQVKDKGHVTAEAHTNTIHRERNSYDEGARASVRPGVTCYGVSVYFVVLKRTARCNNVAEVQCDGITGLE